MTPKQQTSSAQPSPLEPVDLVKISTDMAFLPEVADANRRTFRKAVQAVHCHPVASVEISSLARRVINAFFIHAQQTFASIPEDRKAMIREVRGTPIFKIQIGRLIQMVEVSSHDYARIYEAIENIFAWEFRWNLMQDVSGESQLAEAFTTRMISSYSVGHNELAGQISYEIPHDVLMLVLEPRPFAQIDMGCVNDLKGSSGAIALYESMQRYQGTNSKMTAAMSVEQWVNLLSGVGNYQGKYYDFKRFVVLPAMTWLAKLDSVPFTAELIEIRGPKNRVVALQFKLVKKKQAGLDMAMPPPMWPPQLIAALKTVYGMQTAAIAELAHMATGEEIQEAIQRESAMFLKKRDRGETIQNRDKYLLGVLRNLQLGKAKDAEPELDDTPKIPDSVQLAIERSEKLKADFNSHQLDVILAKVVELDSSTLDELRTEFASSSTTNALLIQKGWNAGRNPLNVLFATWLRKHPVWAPKLLTAPQDSDYAVWSELNK